MMTRLPIRLLYRFSLPWLAGLLLLQPGAASAQQLTAADAESDRTLVVELASGRFFAAELDSRTDDAALWLRFD